MDLHDKTLADWMQLLLGVCGLASIVVFSGLDIQEITTKSPDKMGPRSSFES